MMLGIAIKTAWNSNQVVNETQQIVDKLGRWLSCQSAIFADCMAIPVSGRGVVLWGIFLAKVVVIGGERRFYVDVNLFVGLWVNAEWNGC